MRAFVIFATLMAVAVARPDIGLKLREQGYNYQSPGSNGGFSAGGNSYNGGNGGSSSFASGSSGDFGSSGGFAPSGGSNGNFGSPSGRVDSFGGSSGGFEPSGGSSDGAIVRGQSQVIDLGGSSGGGVIYKPVVRQGEPQITKSFYIHEAPEDEENLRVEEKVINVRPQKHYKIIFIKAPSSGGSVGGHSVPIFPQSEEKTIVYVLSKKHEAISENGEFPTPPPPITSKPEVFFVKYKTNQEADHAVSKIQESFQEGGPGFHSPDSFAKTIGASSGGDSSFSNGGSSFRSQETSGSQPSFAASQQSFGGSQPSFGGSQQAFSGPQVSYGESQGIDARANEFESAHTNEISSASAGASSATSDPSRFQAALSSLESSGVFSGGSSIVVPQQMIEIPVASSAFRSEYIPPAGKK